MASKIEICNLALSRLGSKTIISFSDNTVESKTLNIIYNQVAENVMSLGPWSSTLTRATLAQLTTEPTYEFGYAYQLPTDPKCLRVLTINEDKLGDNEYKIEGSTLLTDLTSVDISYIGFITDTEQYDPYLRQAITERLVVELAYSRTGDPGLAGRLEQMFDAKVDRWLNINGAQGSNFDLPSDTFTNTRNDC